ncbi:hypothetical protein GFS24_26525 [Chitinophaga sp. SYP-B3965]|uniref:hypothetical protein n=1 Tax=Chitinophaga sp. SYP-B3965 TaxID=2663120 RepID=UPI0012995094|nr:hypothetical protein [Chitinophaga sp. SYP-B3965]MRG48695.1 hypothetical protein [Chitinophaga sp. SYP-B3965]
MALTNDNVILRKATGTFAKQIVFRQRFGKTVMCNRPCKYPPKTPTQIANQERFSRANDFAKAAVKDPEKKAYYQSIKKPNQTAFNAAFQDAYNKPEVEVSVKEKTITIKVTGKHRVEKVKVGNSFAVLKNNEWEHKLVETPFIVQVYDIAGNICTIDYGKLRATRLVRFPS